MVIAFASLVAPKRAVGDEYKFISSLHFLPLNLLHMFPSCFDLFCFWVNKPTFIIFALVPTRLEDEPIEAKRTLLLRNEMPYLHSVNKTRSDLFTDSCDAKSTFSFTC